jgi:hypothetical protein
VKAHPSSYLVGTGGYFPVVKRLESYADHSHSYSAELENAWSYMSASPYVFMTWCLLKHRNKFTVPYLTMKVKVKLSLCFLTERQSMKAYWWSGCIVPRILDLGTRGR